MVVKLRESDLHAAGLMIDPLDPAGVPDET
jgi:hypothetical protein